MRLARREGVDTEHINVPRRAAGKNILSSLATSSFVRILHEPLKITSRLNLRLRIAFKRDEDRHRPRHGAVRAAIFRNRSPHSRQGRG